MSKYSELVEKTAADLIARIEAGTAPWQKGWGSDGTYEMPENATTDKAYRGMNAMILLMRQVDAGYKSNRWVTYKQAQELGGHVKKGEKSTTGVYWSIKEDEEDITGKKKAIHCVFHVFNIEQCEGIEQPEQPETIKEFHPIESAENILSRSGAVINHTTEGRAYYSPSTDEITLPKREKFISESAYYDTALHELGHWSGAVKRLNRDLSGHFGTPSYAREELRAEIASMLLAMVIGLPHNTENHAAYVSSWVKIIKKDPKEIWHAVADAEKIKDYILNL